MTKIIDVQNCDVIINGTQILHDINFSLKKGDSLAIIGPNGCGKTTLTRMLVRDGIYPAMGRPKMPVLKVIDEDLDLFSFRKKLGFVSGKFANDLINSYVDTVYEAVASGITGTYGFFRKKEGGAINKQKINNALDQIGIFHLAERELQTLSTGQLRRVLVARALVNQPEMIFLDEPSIGLDLVSIRNFFNTLKSIADRTSIVLITHHVEEIFPAITHVMLMKEGRITKLGKKEDILTSQNLSEVFGKNIEVNKDSPGYYTAKIV